MTATELARKLTNEALTQLTAALAQGRSESLTAYLTAMARFHHYSWGNIFLILAQRPEATRVAGFHTWRQLGRFVKKGEKGIVIIAPMMIQKQQESHTANDDTNEKILRFRAVYVFDLSQTDGEPLPEIARVTGNPNGHTEQLKALIAKKGIVLEYSDALGSAEGRSHGGRIAVKPNLPPAEEFSVLVHELAHEMLHTPELRRSLTKMVKETEAEAVAFVVCRAIGLETGSAAADYIQLYNGDEAALTASLERIQIAAAEIIEAIAESD